MAELPRDPPILERDAVRLVVRDTEDRILLFHTHELTAPELGEWWELPGGGIDEVERLDYEEDYFDSRWWRIGDVVRSSERFYPRRLPGLLQRFLDGEEIDEPFGLWS